MSLLCAKAEPLMTDAMNTGLGAMVGDGIEIRSIHRQDVDRMVERAAGEGWNGG
jgi:hypothetical protein